MINKQHHFIITIFSLWGLFFSLIHSQAPEIQFITGLHTGESSYTIGDVRKESELRFPLGYSFIEGSLQYTLLNRFNISLTGHTNIGNQNTTFKDYDWIDPSNPGFLSIYSESNSAIKAKKINLDIDTPFYSNKHWEHRIGIGYTYQQYKFTISNTQETLFDTVKAPATTTVLSHTMDYDIEYKFPMIKLKLQPKQTSLYGSITIGYSPYVNVIDTDHHILKQKISKGHSNGSAFLINAHLHYKLSRNTYLTLEGNSLTIETKGIQEQYNTLDLNTITQDITQTITSTPTDIKLGLKFLY